MALSTTAAIVRYVDQAYMTRVFRHWFGVTSGEFVQRSDLQSQVQATAYVVELSY